MGSKRREKELALPSAEGPKLLYGFHHGEDVLGRHLGLEIMDGKGDVARWIIVIALN